MDMADAILSTALHEANVIAMAREGDRVCLKFGYVWLGVPFSDDPGVFYNVEIVLGGIRKIARNDEAVGLLSMEMEHSSVIAFEKHDHAAELVVQWTSFSPRAQDTVAYEFEFETFDMHFEMQPEERD
jgi:hypothetical protein